jgi:hypothetical protein
MGKISNIDNNFFHFYTNTQNNVLRFGSKLLPSSGKTRNPKIIDQKYYTHNTQQHNLHAFEL